ncbi:MAG: ShlB/FhaC/HecB family hemolysin secretion/activation protein [Chlamydiota bacterium]
MGKKRLCYLVFFSSFLFFPLFLEAADEIALRFLILSGKEERGLASRSIPDEEGVYFEDLDVPGERHVLVERLGILLRCPISEELIEEIGGIVKEFYQDSYRPLVSVFVPDQEISEGTLRLVVEESIVACISYEGNQWFSSEQLAGEIRQEVGFPFCADLVRRDLLWLNRTPFRETILLLSPGEEEGTCSLSFFSEDGRPYRLFLGADNAGFAATGKDRLFFGVHLGNLFHADHQLFYRYTTTTRFGRFIAHTGQYSAPLPWRHLLTFYGGYSSIRAIDLAEGITQKGTAWQTSMRYLIPLDPVGGYDHQLQWGIDYKNTDINLVFDAVPILGDRAILTQLAVGYELQWAKYATHWSLETQIFASPGDLFAHQSDEDFASLRPGADSSYVYLRAEGSALTSIPGGWQWVNRSSWQIASANLLSSEQYGLGGLDTVRGYDERIVNTDDAWFFSTEIRTPATRLFVWAKEKKERDTLQWLVFFDYGVGANVKRVLAKEKKYLYLTGIGLGLRYRYRHHAQLRFDMGWPLHRQIAPNITQQSGAQLHVSSQITF